MFYSTTIKEVGYGGAIDIHGNWLTFIGYLPAQVGDTVFTDGNVIFGNVPPRSSVTNIALEASGIPVLCSNLRGYFNKRGVFKSYSIAGELWIANSDKNFAHDLSYDNNEIIDAFISETGAAFIASGGIYKKSSQLDIHYPLDIFAHLAPEDVREWRDDVVDLEYYGYRYFARSHTYPCPLILGSTKFGNLNVPLRIFDDGLLAQSFDLKTYGDMIESYALQCADDILSQSYEYTDDDDAVPFAYIAQKLMDFDKYQTENSGHPEISTFGFDMPDDAVTRPSTFIAYTFAHVLTCNINESGFSGTIFASSYGYCSPYIEPRFRHAYYPYPSSSTTYNTKYAQEWKCVPFGASAIFVISNGSLEKIVSLRNFGGLDSNLTIADDTCAIGIPMWSIISSAYYTWRNFLNIATTMHVDILPYDTGSADLFPLLPVGDGFFRLSKYGTLSFFDSNRNVVADNVSIDSFLYIQAQTAGFDVNGDITSQQGSARYKDLRPPGRFRDRVTIPFNDKPDFIRLKSYPSEDTSSYTLHPEIDCINQDDSTSVLSYNLTFMRNHQARDDAYDYNLDSPWSGSFSSSNWLPPLDAFYRREGNTIENLHFTPLFYDFKNGSYLYGVKGGNLYFQKRSDSGGISVTQVGSDCKNFSLNKLGKISKSKI